MSKWTWYWKDAQCWYTIWDPMQRSFISGVKTRTHAVQHFRFIRIFEMTKVRWSAMVRLRVLHPKVTQSVFTTGHLCSSKPFTLLTSLSFFTFFHFPYFFPAAKPSHIPLRLVVWAHGPVRPSSYHPSSSFSVSACYFARFRDRTRASNEFPSVCVCFLQICTKHKERRQSIAF